MRLIDINVYYYVWICNVLLLICKILMVQVELKMFCKLKKWLHGIYTFTSPNNFLINQPAILDLAWFWQTLTVSASNQPWISPIFSSLKSDTAVPTHDVLPAFSREWSGQEVGLVYDESNSQETKLLGFSVLCACIELAKLMILVAEERLFIVLSKRGSKWFL